MKKHIIFVQFCVDIPEKLAVEDKKLLDDLMGLQIIQKTKLACGIKVDPRYLNQLSQFLEVMIQSKGTRFP